MHAEKKRLVAPYNLLVAVLLVSIIPYFWGLGKPDIQDVDEAAYAEIAREMAVSGNFLDPTLNEAPFDQHPPLGVWLMASSMRLFGITPLAARLPNALLALAGLLLTYLIGKRIADRETGIAAALALITAPGYHLMVRDARLDMALLVFIALAMYGVIAYLYDPKKYLLVIAYVGAALAFLTKGPIGLVVPLLVVGVFILLTRRFNLIWRLGLPWGLVIVAVILFPWYWAMYKAHGAAYLYTLFIVQNFKRFAAANYAGKTDPFFYVHTFLWVFLPWVVAMIWMLAKDFPAFKKARFDLNKIDRKDPAPGLVTIWLIAPIVLMSFSKTKLPQYIFFVLPAAAVIAGRFIRDYLGAALSERGTRAFSTVTALLTALLIAAVVFIVAFMFPFRAVLWFVILGAVLAGLLALALSSLVTKERASLVTALALTVGTVHLLIVLHLSPAMLLYQPYRGFAVDLKTNGITDRDIYFVGKNYKSSFLFYSGTHAIAVNETDLSPLEGATAAGKAVYMIAPAEVVPVLEGAGFAVEIVSTRDYFHTSLPTAKFMFAKTRPEAAKPMVLARVTRAEGP
jgi:4-amino-4-deoxy-L-arabinose transferase-like glycosyltransferase